MTPRGTPTDGHMLTVKVTERLSAEVARVATLTGKSQDQIVTRALVIGLPEIVHDFHCPPIEPKS